MTERVLIGLLDASCPAVQITPLDSKIGGLPVSLMVSYAYRSQLNAGLL